MEETNVASICLFFLRVAFVFDRRVVVQVL